jgi:hypothetical protein
MIQMTSQEAIHDIITRHPHPLQLPARWYLSKPNIPPENNIYGKVEYTNTQQDLHIPKINLPLDMQDFWLVGLFCQKATNTIDHYFQYFSSSSSALIITK